MTDATQHGTDRTEVPVQPTLAPVPSPRTIKQRTSLPVQGFRFAAVSLRMLNMIRKSHH